MSDLTRGVLLNSSQKIKNMGFLKVDNFLCCCTLRTGALVIANMMLIGNVIIFLIALSTYDEAVAAIKARAVSDYHWEYVRTVEGIYGWFITQAVVGILLSGSLICGILYKIHRLLLPYLVCMAMFLVIMTLSTLITPITFSILTAMPAAGAAIFFTHVICVAITLHCWLVIYTYYQELQVAGEVQHITLQEENDP